MQTIRCFEPVVDERSRVLILGSMPGKESLRKAQYYGHARNAFWPLMCTLLNTPYTADYAARLNMLQAHGIALWDVLRSCVRSSSLDADIKNPIVNDFHGFFTAYPRIMHVFFNGGKACETFKRHVGFDFAHITFHKLGSTSPAHAIAFEKRIHDWQRLLTYINQ